MKKAVKSKQIMVRFDDNAYAKINAYAEKEHRGLGEFIRHAALFYIEYFDKEKEPLRERGEN